MKTLTRKEIQYYREEVMSDEKEIIICDMALAYCDEEEKRAPVQGWGESIPWHMHLRAYEAYCKKCGAQPALIDLEGRNCRGGFHTGELDTFIPGWREELSGYSTLVKERDDLKKQLAGEKEKQAEIDDWKGIAHANMQVSVAADKIAESIRAEYDDLLKQLAEEENLHLKTIDERDASEQALSQAYYLVFGEPAEWSNNFGNDQATEAIGDAVNALKKQLADLKEANRVFEKAEQTIRNQFTRQLAEREERVREWEQAAREATKERDSLRAQLEGHESRNLQQNQAIMNLNDSLTTALQRIEELEKCIEPGKAPAIMSGLFREAERLGFYRPTGEHALSQFVKEIEKLRARISTLEADGRRFKETLRAADDYIEGLKTVGGTRLPRTERQILKQKWVKYGELKAANTKALSASADAPKDLKQGE